MRLLLLMFRICWFINSTANLTIPQQYDQSVSTDKFHFHQDHTALCCINDVQMRVGVQEAASVLRFEVQYNMKECI